LFFYHPLECILRISDVLRLDWQPEVSIATHQPPGSKIKNVDIRLHNIQVFICKQQLLPNKIEIKYSQVVEGVSKFRTGLTHKFDKLLGKSSVHAASKCNIPCKICTAFNAEIVAFHWIIARYASMHSTGGVIPFIIQLLENNDRRSTDRSDTNVDDGKQIEHTVHNVNMDPRNVKCSTGGENESEDGNQRSTDRRIRTTDDGGMANETCITEDCGGWITVTRMKKRKDRKE
jgi:hypothetical protein